MKIAIFAGAWPARTSRMKVAAILEVLRLYQSDREAFKLWPFCFLISEFRR